MLANKLVIVAVLLMCSLEASASSAPTFLQEAKLVGTGAATPADQGLSVGLSADGSTAIVGGISDNSGLGAVWVYTRSGGVWSQQGAKLVGTGAVGQASQGISVALSADGNTAIVGGYEDHTYAGAAWIFTRSGGVWSQQGAKLVGSGAVGSSVYLYQGYSVGLSADGNTAIVGGYGDNSGTGAAWVYTRSGGVWSQQGPKLAGSGALGAAHQGISVALSADGNTAVVGGSYDNNGIGAVWVYTRNGGVWSQQGAKLVGTGAVGNAGLGVSVALSADGNIAFVGGPDDNSSLGAAWIYTRSGEVWSQQGDKLVGSGAVGRTYQGYSVALSADGNIALVGGPNDNSSLGAAWVFTSNDGAWSQQGSKLVGTDVVGNPHQGHSVALSADGNTAVLGGPDDNRIPVRDDPYAYQTVGAAWVFVNEIATPALLSLESTDPEPDCVTLTWQSESALGLSATVYRYDMLSGWQPLGAPTLVPPDRLQFVDRAVAAGARYAYRLGYTEGGSEQFTAETWVDVPRPAVLSLDGARPNPSTGAMNVFFSLPNESPATLTVLDIAGRVVMAREVGSLGAGQHLVPLGSTIAPGVYWLRLAQTSRALYARTVVIR
jgi:hypothetical protein